ncbi:uncharacterized protein LOC143485412 isoform X2 [Brachyhypopomus gauderio]|uniref:uncharacterized protein LOC143475576 isoform X2 n=1 Tax=Brachyhypopomus gauderio TaxID=698409 RepID=UPI00404320E7
MELRKRKLNPKEEAAYFTSACKDKDGFDVKYINPDKGRGVFSCVHFDKGDFLLEYRGDLINKHECERRQRIYKEALKVFMFEFRYNGKLFCVDASLEDKSLGRLVNDDHVSPNSKMKTIRVAGKPHLCLFATRSISPGEEITYNYGDSEWPWRCKAVPGKEPVASATMATLSPDKEPRQNLAEMDAEETTSAPLTMKDQLWTEEHHSQIPYEVAQEAISAKGPVASATMATLSPDKEPRQNLAEMDAEETTSAPLTMKDQLWTEEHHSQIPYEVAQEAIPAKGPVASATMATLSPDKEPRQNCKHEIVLATVSSMNKCVACVGPVAALKWIGLRCKVCSCFWHKSCFEKLGKIDRDLVSWGKRDSSSDEDQLLSDEDYVPDTESDSESDSSVEFEVGCEKDQVSEQNMEVHSKFSESCSSVLVLKYASRGNGKQCLQARKGACLSEDVDLFCYEKQLTDVETDNELDNSKEGDVFSTNVANWVKPILDVQLSSDDAALDSGMDLGSSRSVTVTPTREELLDARVAAGETDFQNVSGTEQRDTVPVAEKSAVISCSKNSKNYCYICGKPQSKISRHLKIHMTEVEVAEALSFPKHSKERKRLLEKIRNKGNYQHNSNVLQKGSGLLKLKRRPNRVCNSKQFVHCMYCKGMFLRKDLWRHVRRCSSKPGLLNEQQGRTKVLGLAALAESTFSQQISQGVWKLLSAMKQDDVGSVVRNDFCILQLAQSFFNKHGNDPTKHEYVRQKLREIGRFLMALRSESSIHSLEEAVKPANFSKVIQAVRKVSGYDEEKNCYHTPSLALKLGHTLQKICEIVQCRALMAEDEDLVKSTEMFKRLYTTKWSELISHQALSTLNEAKFNKPSTLPFTHDVQLLHKHLETTADAASENLKKTPSPQSYADLAKTTLARIIVFNRRRAGEVSKMHLKNFQERDKTLLHEDVAVGLSAFEQKLCSHFSRVEIKGKRGRKVAVLLTPDMVDALSLLVSKRNACGVQDANCFLFARPSCQSHYRGQDCLRFYAVQCGARNPEHLRSTHLRKHVATLSQILNLKNNELDQVADFLGHDIRVHREYYRLPEATTQLAKISKLLLAMEKGCLPDLQGKSLDDIEIEDEINTSDVSDGSEPENEAVVDSMSAPRQTQIQKTQTDRSIAVGCSPVCNDNTAAEIKGPGKRTKTLWSKQEVMAVMKHFKPHITKGKLATMGECQQCKDAEDPVLAGRTVQNIRDFVRNRGKTFQRKAQSN